MTLTLPIDPKKIPELRKSIEEELRRVAQEKAQLDFMMKVLQDSCLPYHRYQNGSSYCANCNKYDPKMGD